MAVMTASDSGRVAAPVVFCSSPSATANPSPAAQALGKRSWADIVRVPACAEVPVPPVRVNAAADHSIGRVVIPLPAPASNKEQSSGSGTSSAGAARMARMARAAAPEAPPTTPDACHGDAESCTAGAGRSSDMGSEATVCAKASDEAEDEEEEKQLESEPRDDLPEGFEDDPLEGARESEIPARTNCLKPGRRGGYSCLCSGEVLVMLGHYGWLRSLSDIDHPDSGKNGGRIYFEKCDIVGDVDLVEGDVVSFYLYVDTRGLGAEECHLEGCAASTAVHPKITSRPKKQWLSKQHLQVQQRPVQHGQPKGLCRNAAEFVPVGALDKAAPSMSAGAPEFVPGARVAAAGFVPAAQRGISTHPFGTASMVVAQVPHMAALSTSLNCFVFNDAYLSDDSDDEGSTSAGGSGSSDGGLDSGCEQNCQSDQLFQRVPLGLHGRGSKQQHADTAAMRSDSEEGELETTGAFLAPPPGLLPPPPTFAPPPPPLGLSTVGLCRPPPGLTLL